jgi:hypothetical protein
VVNTFIKTNTECAFFYSMGPTSHPVFKSWLLKLRFSSAFQYYCGGLLAHGESVAFQLQNLGSISSAVNLSFFSATKGRLQVADQK